MARPSVRGYGWTMRERDADFLSGGSHPRSSQGGRREFGWRVLPSAATGGRRGNETLAPSPEDPTCWVRRVGEGSSDGASFRPRRRRRIMERSSLGVGARAAIGFRDEVSPADSDSGTRCPSGPRRGWRTDPGNSGGPRVRGRCHPDQPARVPSVSSQGLLTRRCQSLAVGAVPPWSRGTGYRSPESGGPWSARWSRRDGNFPSSWSPPQCRKTVPGMTARSGGL